MIGLDSQARIWLCSEPTDTRKSFQGLSALVRNQLRHGPLSGQYFVFVNRRKTEMKILYFTATGYCLWAKRLEQGQFRVPLSASGQWFRHSLQQPAPAAIPEAGSESE
jgi:transposase